MRKQIVRLNPSANSRHRTYPGELSTRAKSAQKSKRRRAICCSRSVLSRRWTHAITWRNLALKKCFNQYGERIANRLLERFRLHLRHYEVEMKVCTLSAMFIWMMSFAVFRPANAQSGTILPQKLTSPATIIVGFVGGFVRPDDDRHLEVQMIERLASDFSGIHAVVFENRHTVKARREILRLLDTNGDDWLSEDEKRRARIIVLGHSWGGSAAIRLANELNDSGVPVLLTIQLDSINKGPGDDCVVPPNVALALNFYQTRGLAHGCRTLRPVDASRTQILGNFRLEYTAQPAGCSSYSWFDRHLLKTHNAMDCDPQVWSQVEKEIRARIQESNSEPTNFFSRH